MRCIGTPKVCEGHRIGRMLVRNRDGRHSLKADRECHIVQLQRCLSTARAVSDEDMGYSHPLSLQMLCAGHTLPESAQASMPAQLSLPSEDVLYSEGLTSATLDEEGGAEQAIGAARADSFRKLPSFALPDRHLSSTHSTPREPLPGAGDAEQRLAEAPSATADPLGATISVGRRSTDGSPLRPAMHSLPDAARISQQVQEWSPSKSSAGSSPARQLLASSEPLALGTPPHGASAVQPALQPMQDVSLGSQADTAAPSVPLSALSARASPLQAVQNVRLECRVPAADAPQDTLYEASASSSKAAEVPAVRDDSASADIRALTREISELAYIDRDPVYGSPVRRYRPTDDVEEHFENSAAERSSGPAEQEGMHVGADVQSCSEQTQDSGQEADVLEAAGSPNQDAGTEQKQQEAMRSSAL